MGILVALWIFCLHFFASFFSMLAIMFVVWYWYQPALCLSCWIIRACISSFIWNHMEFILLFSMRVLKESAIDCERQCFSLINHHIMTLQVYTLSIPVTRKLYSTFVNGLFDCIEMDHTSTLIFCTCYYFIILTLNLVSRVQEVSCHLNLTFQKVCY